MVRKLMVYYQVVNILSLDVAVGAVICCLFFASVMHVFIIMPGYVALGLTVWIIYTVDHLLDAKATHGAASSLRHRFHQRYFDVLLAGVFLAILLDLTCVVLVPKPLVLGGSVLGVVVLFYLQVQKRLKFMKELSGTVLYCSGVLMPIGSLGAFPWTTSQTMLVVQFALTVWCNMILFAWYDYSQDIADHHASIVTVMGKRKTLVWLLAVLSLTVLLGCLHLVGFPMDAIPVGVLLAMDFVLVSLIVCRKWLKADELYRIFGDGIFLLPAILLLL